MRWGNQGPFDPQQAVRFLEEVEAYWDIMTGAYMHFLGICRPQAQSHYLVRAVVVHCQLDGVRRKLAPDDGSLA